MIVIRATVAELFQCGECRVNFLHTYDSCAYGRCGVERGGVGVGLGRGGQGVGTGAEQGQGQGGGGGYGLLQYWLFQVSAWVVYFLLGVDADSLH